MKVVLKESGKLVGHNNAIPTQGATSGMILHARAFRTAHGLAWEPDAPPSKSTPIMVPYTQQEDANGEYQMVIAERFESLFRSDPTFKPVE